MKEEIVTNEKIYYQFLACLSRKGGDTRLRKGMAVQKDIIMQVFYMKTESKAQSGE